MVGDDPRRDIGIKMQRLAIKADAVFCDKIIAEAGHLAVDGNSAGLDPAFNLAAGTMTGPGQDLLDAFGTYVRHGDQTEVASTRRRSLVLVSASDSSVAVSVVSSVASAMTAC